MREGPWFEKRGRRTVGVASPRSHASAVGRWAAAVCTIGLVVACDDRRAAPAPPAPAPAPAPSAAAPPAIAPSASAAPAAVSAATEPPNAVAAQHILVAYRGAKQAPPGVTRSKAEAKKRAEEVVAKCRAPGADFSALATEYSDDPGSKDRLGNLGKFTRDKMIKAFSDVAFALKVGDVSDPVETPFGFHVIKRNQ